MTRAEQLDAQQLLEDLMEWGAQADLRFPSNWTRRVNAEAAEITAHGGYLLELRHVPKGQPNKVFGRELRALRLYYYEPLRPEQTLAALALGSKPANASDSALEQNEAIDAAHERAQHWDIALERMEGTETP
jgi:hypothetical protein